MNTPAPDSDTSATELKVTGEWYPATSSARFRAELVLGQHAFQLHAETQPCQQGNSQQLHFSDRVGNIPRKIRLPDNSLFQTADNQAIDDWLSESSNTQHSKASRYFHHLESNTRMIAFSLLFVIAFSTALLRWGLPWASSWVADRLPVAVAETVGKNTLDSLDHLFLAPSALSQSQQQKIRHRFRHEIAPLFNDDQGYELHFRQLAGQPDMANAFALPSGDIVVTDALARVLNAAQLDAVLLHEIGHIYHRHSMQRVIHNASLSLIILAALGNDMTLSEELIAGLPVFLMHQHYSRQAEHEADQFAVSALQKQQKSPLPLAEALEIITQTDGENHEEDNSDYLSTHPATEKRLARIREQASHQ
ncbi:MAG: M48 family metallopeptidase [Marinobacterium sp.]|nr:M48 family metallopeptidase [Marinobacterium sp.]